MFSHPLVRSSLGFCSNAAGSFEVVAEASHGDEAIDLAVRHKPDVILLDVGMPRLSGPDAAHSMVRTKAPGARILMLSMHPDEAYVLPGAGAERAVTC